VTSVLATRTRLPPETASPSQARRLVQRVVEEAGLDELLDGALLLVTELVTNAVVHAGTDVELTVDVEEAGLWVEVSDGGAGRIWAGDAPPENREGGRGIFLLAAIADEWGTSYGPGRKGVWFRLGAST